MPLVNFRKETSERSDGVNWAKALLIEKSGYYLESIEGCNQNAENLVTHLIERARVDLDSASKGKIEDVISSIIELEGRETLVRKINFAKFCSLPLTYVLYCDETEHVFMFNFNSIEDYCFVKRYRSYQEFSNWIASVKGWRSNKTFRETQDLPKFDIALRKAGTAWPTNIDCFICDRTNKPIAILEFQNANNTAVKQHCNNDFFLCKMTSVNQQGNTIYHDDIRRWTSQEILRVQSGLRYLILTWAQTDDDYIVKEVEVITIPHFPMKSGIINWQIFNAYKATMNKYVRSGKLPQVEHEISNVYKSYNFHKAGNSISTIINEPPLSYGQKTFPSIYYYHKVLIENNKESLVDTFIDLLKS